MMIPDDSSGIFDGGEGCSWNSDTNRLLKAVDDESLDALEVLFSKGVPLNAHGGAFHETPLHKAAQQGWGEGLQLLLSNGATANSMNQFGQTPLHYAAASKSCECIRSLLDSGGCQATLDHKDMRGHTPLHDSSAAGHPDGVALFLKAGAGVDMRDKKDETPLHKAARARCIPAMLALLNHGADLGARDKTGESVLSYVLRHIPGGMETLLDYCLTPNADKLTSKKLEVDFNFVPLAGSSELNQMRTLSDIVAHGHPKLLLHPVCEAYLLLKWHNVRRLFFIEVIFYFVHAILATVVILDKFVWQCKGKTQQDPCSGISNRTQEADEDFVDPCFFNSTAKADLCSLPPAVFDSFKVIVIMMVSVILIKQVLTIIQGVRSWLFSVWHVLNGVISVLVLTVIPGEFNMWQHHVATVTLLVLWVQCMLHIGRFPGCGIYVAMFTRVAKVFVRMFLIFFCLLLAFSLSFYVSYGGRYQHSNGTQTEEEDPVFGNPLITFIKTLTMMIGELDFDSAFVQQLNYLAVTSHLIYLSFVILVSIILSNLLVALAVNDVQGLRNSAHLERLIKQMELVYQMERTFCSLTAMAHLTKFWWFNEKLRIFVHDFSFTKIFVQPFHPQKGNKLMLVERGILKEINLRQNHVSNVMECLRLREEESMSSTRKASVRKNRKVRSDYSTFTGGQDEIGDLLKKVERNLLEAFIEKMEETTDTLASLSSRLRTLEEAFMCNGGEGEGTPVAGDELSVPLGSTTQWKNLTNHVLQPSIRKPPHPRSSKVLGNSKTGGSLFRHSQPTLRHQHQQREQRSFMSQQHHSSAMAQHAQVATGTATAAEALAFAPLKQQPQPHQEQRSNPNLLQENKDPLALENLCRVQFEMVSQRSAPLPTDSLEDPIVEVSERKKEAT